MNDDHIPAYPADVSMFPTTVTLRLPKHLRRRAGEERQAVPPLDDEPRPCFHCDGTGWFTECVEASNGRDEDVDYRCGACDGTGVES